MSFLVLQCCVFNDAPIQMGGTFQNEPKTQGSPCMEILCRAVHCCQDIIQVYACTFTVGIISRYEIMALDGSCLGKSLKQS